MLEQTAPSYLSDASHCPYQPPSERRRRSLLSALSEEDDPFKFDDFMKSASFWLIGSVIGALGVGLLFVYLVGKRPSLLVGIAIGVQVGLPFLAGTGALLSAPPGHIDGMGLFLFLFAAIVALVFWLWREQLVLVTQLLGLSGKGLQENLSLVPCVIGVQGGLLSLTFPLLLSLFAAIANGHVVFNPSRNPESTTCLDMQGQEVLCCVWETEPFVGPYLTYALLIMTWTCFIGGEVRTFVVSGVIAQWYFRVNEAPESDKATRSRPSRVFASLSAALGTSFGSLCCGGAILTLVSILRSILEQLKKNAEKNVFIYCFFVLCNYFFTLIELVTKFATVRLAITGETFLEASKGVTDLLSRNFLNTFGVWWFPPMILHMASIVLSSIWASIIWMSSSHAWADRHQGAMYAGALAFVAFLLSWAVVSFFASLIINVVEAVYICFALDRDLQAVTRYEVHEVYEKIPSINQVIQNPDGSVAYAARGQP
jgi:hypothetical protein